MTHHPHIPAPSDPGAAFKTPDLVVPSPGAIHLGSEISEEQARQFAENQQRLNLIRELGLPTEPHRLMDDFADYLAHQTGMAYGFVNLFLDAQTFVGLHNPDPELGYLPVGRTMAFEHGFCPEVVARKKALPIREVFAFPRYAGNHVVNALGVRSYFGAPLIHESGVVLGTVCTIDPEPRPLSDARRLLETVKATGTDVLRALPSVSVR
ncbi:GAF domain-containing protein [Streptomyces canus]|uniref:GAF domain-containing protein n=1 Tax=Streptomyces canus TaxID=58343 RepID=UPI0033C63E1F